MLSTIVAGQIVTEPKHGTSKAGTAWANCVVRCPCGQNRETGEQESAFVQVAAFGDEAAKLAKLTKGDSVSATGALKPTTYQKNGEERNGLSLTATGILTAYQARKKRGDSDRASRETSAPSARSAPGWEVYAPATSAGAAFDDPVSF